MIFKRKKGGPNPDEPKTKSGLFEPVRDTAAAKGLSSAPKDSPKENLPSHMEPPTRDAIFKDAPVKAKTEPPVGWIAVIAGPDKGKILPLGYEDTALDVGGTSGGPKISYDAAAIEFSLQSENGPQTLSARDEFKAGENTLLFLPLCADGFDWKTS